MVRPLPIGIVGSLLIHIVLIGLSELSQEPPLTLPDGSGRPQHRLHVAMARNPAAGSVGSPQDKPLSRPTYPIKRAEEERQSQGTTATVVPPRFIVAPDLAAIDRHPYAEPFEISATISVDRAGRVRHLALNSATELPVEIAASVRSALLATRLTAGLVNGQAVDSTLEITIRRE